MPSIHDNLVKWNDTYEWPRNGDEWSAPWGGSENQWKYTILPRVKPWLPAGCILEIGTGRGRWTEFLIHYCKSFVGVDLSIRCIEACKSRFSHLHHATFFANDGQSLDTIKEQSVDFVFSFDSLVHCEPDVIGLYLKHLKRVLKDAGAGFIHHSNLGHYKYQLSKHREADEFWRSREMSAQAFQILCRNAGLQCQKQELVNWLDSRWLLDGFSWFGQPSASLTSRLEQNFRFMEEARYALARTRLERCANRSHYDYTIF